MSKQEPITHLLFVDKSNESKTAVVLCKRTIRKGLHIIDGEPELHPPQLVTPEGSFITLEKVRDYLQVFGERTA